MARQIVLGLTGRNGAGKGALAAILVERGFRYLSLSDAIRAHIKEKGISESRAALIAAGNELRRAEGPGTLGERTLGLIIHDPDTRLFVVDSIRNPAEVAALRQHEVEANEAVRFERLVTRNRKGDSLTLTEFLEHERLELESGDSSAQQLLATAAMADHTMTNNGDLEELQEAMTSLLALLQKN